MKGKQQKCLSILKIYFLSIRWIFVMVFVTIFVIFIISQIVLTFFDIPSVPYTAIDVFINAFALLIVILPTVFLICRHWQWIYYIRLQESALGFSFNEEMKKNDINEFPKKHSRDELGRQYQDENWFIAITNTRIITLHRNYVLDIGDIKFVFFMNWMVVVNGTDGRKLKIIGGLSSINDLRTWFDTPNGGRLYENSEM